MICPECGKHLPDDAAFCVRCGENLNNPNAEVYKKTKLPEEKTDENSSEKTRVLNIIPDEAALYGMAAASEEDTEAPAEDNSADEDENSAPKRRRRRKPVEESRPVKSKDDEEDEDEDDEEETETSSAPKFTVITVVLALLICAGIIIYFFTQNTIRSRELQAQMTTTEISETTIETTVSTTEETTTETEPPVETTVMTDAENNSYTIEIAEDIPAKVALDTGTLRVRAYPSTESSILGQLANGQDVSVIGVCGEWYYISYGENKGFVFSEYIKTEEPEETEMASEDIISDIAETVEGDSDVNGNLNPEEDVISDTQAE